MNVRALLTRWIGAIGIGALALALAGCGLSVFTDPKANPVLEDRVGKWGSQPLATLATTAERRIVLLKIDPEDRTYFGKFCTEPPPDAAENIANKFALALEAAVKMPQGEGQGRLEFARDLATSVQQLFRRTQGLQLYRDGMYSLCQGYLNGLIEPKDFREKAQNLLDQSTRLIHHELKLTGGMVAGPGPAALPARGEDVGFVSGLGQRSGSEWIRANALITQLRAARKADQPADQQKVTLNQLYEVLVVHNAKEKDEKKQTLSAAEQQVVLDRLRPLAKPAAQQHLAAPSQLEAITDQAAFQAFFL